MPMWKCVAKAGWKIPEIYWQTLPGFTNVQCRCCTDSQQVLWDVEGESNKTAFAQKFPRHIVGRNVQVPWCICFS